MTLEYFADTAVPVSRLLEASGIQPADLSGNNSRITPHQELQVCANGLTLREDLGLELGQRMHISAYGILGYAALSSATFGDAWRLMLEYPALLGTYFKLDLNVEGELAWVSASNYQQRPELEVFNVEMCLASLRTVCADLLGQVLPLSAAQFRYSEPTYSNRYANSFDCPVRFDAPSNAFAFPASWLTKRLPLADAITHQDTLMCCRKLNSELSARQIWLARIRELLAGQLADSPGLEQLAQQMHCSPRTLRRHLQALGTHYQELLDDLRFERAKDLLCQEGWPVGRIAEELGFSESASFRHAFQRWSGIAPSHFRP